MRDAEAMRTCRPYLLVCDAVEICSSFRHEQTWFHKEAILLVQRKIAGFFRQENNYKKSTALYPIKMLGAAHQQWQEAVQKPEHNALLHNSDIG